MVGKEGGGGSPRRKIPEMKRFSGYVDIGSGIVREGFLKVIPLVINRRRAFVLAIVLDLRTITIARSYGLGMTPPDAIWTYNRGSHFA